VLGSSVPGAEVPAGTKGTCTLETHGLAGDRTVTSQCPSRNTVPRLGKKCGRRERESRREGRREQSLRVRHHSFACRDGERHPGFLEGGSLRGASLERRPRSVRRPQRVSSRGGSRADDSGCPKVAEEGNAVSMRHQAHAPVAGTRDRRMRTRDASFARSFDPCTLILTMLLGASRGGEAFGRASRSGKPAQAGGTGTGARSNGRSAARRVSPISQGRGRDTSKEKEGDRGLRPCEDPRARV